ACFRRYLNRSCPTVAAFFAAGWDFDLIYRFTKIKFSASSRQTRARQPSSAPKGRNLDSPAHFGFAQGRLQCRETFETIGSPAGTAPCHVVGVPSLRDSVRLSPHPALPCRAIYVPLLRSWCGAV